MCAVLLLAAPDEYRRVCVAHGGRELGCTVPGGALRGNWASTGEPLEVRAYDNTGAVISARVVWP